MKNLKSLKHAVFSALFVGAAMNVPALAEDWPMWLRTADRNAVTAEKGAPTEFDVDKGTNIKWKQQLGSQSYGNPVIAGGLVFVGTNNEAKRDAKYDADGGVLMIFRESDGKFLWQWYRPKLASGRVNDWPYQGICSTVLAEGDFIYFCTNRSEVVKMDVSPLRRGSGEPKIAWNVDLIGQLNNFPHNMTSCSMVSYRDYVYVITGNGVDDTHQNIPQPKAPSIVCFNKNDGSVKWSDNSVGENILHGQWSSPAVTEVNGRGLVIAPLGDGWIYAYDFETGEKVWYFDSNAKNTVYPTTRNELIATPVVHDNKVYIANGQDVEHGEGPGHLWCVDITGKGDISKELSDAPKPKLGEELLAPAGQIKAGKPNPNSKVVWDFEGNDKNNNGRFEISERMNRSFSTCAIYNGLVFIADLSGIVHCLDARTGQHHWTYDMEAAIWGSPSVIDGKVYLADEDGDVTILDASNQLKEIGTHNLGNASYGSPVYANGTLYVMTKDMLYAISAKK
jgi:outer membrane protein assembly factor BamB